MARFDGKKITGLLGNLVFKNSEDKKRTIVQTKPIHVTQAPASQLTAKIFAKSSSLAKLMRSDFNLIINGSYDGSMINRFTKVNRAILDDCYDRTTSSYIFTEYSFRLLSRFEFNSKSLLVNYFLVNTLVDLQGTRLAVTIPSFETKKQLKFPPHANSCQLKIVVAGYNFDKQIKLDPFFDEYDIDTSQLSIPGKTFLYELPAGCLCVVGLGVDYYYQNQDVKTTIK